MQTRILGIASLNRGPFSPHLNISYTLSSDGSLPGATLSDEISATAGFDVAVNPRMTMSFDVLSRTLRDAGRMRLSEKTFDMRSPGPEAVAAVAVAAGRRTSPDRRRDADDDAYRAAVRARRSSPLSRRGRRAFQPLANDPGDGQSAVPADRGRTTRSRDARAGNRLRLLVTGNSRLKTQTVTSLVAG